MKTYARIDGGSVVELIELVDSADISQLFNAALVWVDVSAILPPPQIGWAATHTGGVWGFSAPVVAAPTVAQALATLAMYRYGAETAGVYFQPAAASSPTLVPTDRVSQVRLNGAFAMAAQGKWVDGTPWKIADGVYITLTTADVIALGEKSAAYVAGCYAHEATLAAAIASSPTAAITAGWPSNT